MNGFVSGYYKFAVWVTRLAYLNILWVAFTIVGLGLFGLMPSTMAMFAVARKWVMGERDIPIFKTFWDTYKKDFVKTNGIGLIIFTAIYILVIEFRILFNHEQLIYNLAAFGVVAIAILLAIVLTYIFPIYVHFNLRVRDYFTWPLVIGITHPILTVVLTVGIGALYYIVYNIIPVIVFLFGGSVAAYLLTLGGQQVFYKYEARDDDDDEDEARDDDEMEAITEVTEEKLKLGLLREWRMRKVIRDARFIDGRRHNLVIENGVIVELTDRHITGAKEINLPDNVYVSPGWIDLHVHAFPKFKPYCSNPDEIGYPTGVTTIIDAGSSGADDIDEFFQMASESITNVLSIINISRIGLKSINELADLENISYTALERAVQNHPDKIVGLKARMSGSVVGGNGVIPLDLAKEYGSKLNLPVMVHIGNAPPLLSEILKRLTAGDIITHCYNDKENNHIFSNGNKELLLEAINKGVYLDVGHGSASFSFDIAKRAKEENIAFDTISTDIYEGNMKNGPVYNMARTLTKFLSLGYSLEEVIKAVTEVPAKIINQPELGELKIGTPADLTFFTLEEESVQLIDSAGKELQSSVSIKPHSVLIGEIIMSANELGLKRTINASGRMSILGVSTLSDEVISAMKNGGQNYFEMADLHEKVGQVLASYLKTEAVMVTNSASASIALSIAGIITKDNAYNRKHLHNKSLDINRGIVLMKGHNVDYGAPVETMVQLGGGIIQEAGYANGCTLEHIEATISAETVAFLYVKSHHCVQKNMPSLRDIKALCEKHDLPLIIDIAAEEEIDAYAAYGDLIILSGSKAIEGPTSGILAGKSTYVNYARAHSSGIGRAMKVGKESILGLLQAVKDYGRKTMSKATQLEVLDKLTVLSALPGVSVTITQDEAGREIFRGRVAIDENHAMHHALEVVNQLKLGDTAVYTRDYNANIGYFDIDPRPLLTGDIEIIVEKLTLILGGN